MSEPIPDPANSPLRLAEMHLAGVSPLFAEMIARVGPCTLTPEPDVFRVIVRAIVAQLISTAAAPTISGRLEEAVKGKLTPASVLKLTDEQFQACGISGAKRRAIRVLAEQFQSDRRFRRRLAEADDETVRGLLLPLSGIGPWTVDMVLIFGMGRPDVLAIGDMGLRAGVRDLFGLPELPTPRELQTLTEPWRPYRSIATWYIWRSRGWVPQSEPSE